MAPDSTMFSNGANANVKRRYAVHFDEGDDSGYLLIDYLSNNGQFSRTMLIRSVATGEIHVRKLHDVQLFDPNKTIQCDDERLAVSHSNVPALIATKYYEDHIDGEFIDDETGETEIRTYHYTTPVTIWQFCNGGTIEDIYKIWDEYARDRVPEAVLWHFIETLVRTFVELNISGVAQADSHEGNLLLHWETNSYIPDIFIIDFGLARTFPTAVDDTNFRRPWTGNNFNETVPVSSSMSEEQCRALGMFYAVAMQDHKDAILLIQSLVLSTRNAKYRDVADPDDVFAINAQAGKGIDHVGSALIQAIYGWSQNVICTNPPLFMTNMQNLLQHIQTHATFHINQFLANPAEAHSQTAWLRPAPHKTRPALWKDPTPLFTPIDPEDDMMVRLNAGDAIRNAFAEEDSGEDKFAAYREGDWRYERPRISIIGRDMTQPVALRTGEFQVVELAYDVSTGVFQVLRTVTSMDQVGPLSPDSPTS